MPTVPRRVAPHINPYSRPHPIESESIVERATKAARDAWEEATGRTPALSQDEAWAVTIRAAISAMREPTEEMVAAGEKVVDDQYDHYDPGKFYGVGDLWPRMIDAALK